MIDVSLTFNGDKRVTLENKDADDRTLLEVMFKKRGAWKAEVNEAGGVVLTPLVVKDHGEESA